MESSLVEDQTESPAANAGKPSDIPFQDSIKDSNLRENENIYLS